MHQRWNFCWEDNFEPWNEAYLILYEKLLLSSFGFEANIIDKFILIIFLFYLFIYLFF